MEENNINEPQNPIITPGDPERFPLLEMPSRPCSMPLTPADEQAILEMDAILETLDEQAAGIAAVQIGFPHRIFLLRNGQDEDGNASNNVYINPRILSKSRETKKDYEACLSLPGMFAHFKRPKKVTIEYLDLDGNLQQETFTGFWSRAVCHEMDHLNGHLISQEIEKAISHQPKRNKFGMIMDEAAHKRIATRRRKNKRAKQARKAARRR